ncbi:MAG: helix-turn-helix domain-containing protein [Puia sp.]|nr:helix-turn-helix domain-containing protein [Puia sp.]
MSSNLSIKKICEHCRKVFTAKTTVTKFCSDECAKKNYKLRQRQAKINASNADTQEKIIKPEVTGNSGAIDDKVLIDIKMLSAITSIGERTLYRMVKVDGFPSIKRGRSLRFHKETVIEYILKKFGKQ